MEMVELFTLYAPSAACPHALLLLNSLSSMDGQHWVDTVALACVGFCQFVAAVCCLLTVAVCVCG